MDYKGEIISIHLGQAGSQIGHACWELNCLEHQIHISGRHANDGYCDDKSFHAFFRESQFGQFVPRAVFIDSEPTVLDEIRSGSYRELFDQESLVSGFDDAACNYARGLFTKTEEMHAVASNAIRRQTETCDRLQGFFIHHSLGGGTGTGLGTSILKSLSREYKKKAKIEMAIFPSPRLQSFVVEPYNSLLASSACIDDSEVVFTFDNEAAWDNIKRNLNVKRPTFTNINRVMAQIVSSVTAPMRFQGDLQGDLTAYRTNLVPYPRLHFPVISYAPLVPAEKALHQSNTVDTITKAVFEPKSTMFSVDIKRGMYMSVVIMYRGDIDSVSTNRSIQEIKRNSQVKFVDWCPTGFKVDINRQPVTVVPGADLSPCMRSCTALANTTAVSQALEICQEKYKKLYSKRAYVHWYVSEGLDEATFQECESNIQQLISDYQDAANQL